MARLVVILLCFVLLSCSSGDRDSSVGTGVGNSDCGGFCADADSFLTVNEVERIIAQAAAEASARGAGATIAVVDRVGNVLGVFRMNAAATQITVSTGRGVTGGLEGLNFVPDSIVAIAKAITGAYLSSKVTLSAPVPPARLCRRTPIPVSLASLQDHYSMCSSATCPVRI